MSGLKNLPGMQLATGLLLLAWPFLIWFGLAYNSLRWLLPPLVLLLMLRLYQLRRQVGPMQRLLQGTALVGIVLCLASAALKSHQLLLLYPVLVNLLLLAIFGASLWSAMPLVERLARLREPNLTPAGVRYTRRVTQVWCAFFIVNGTIALATTLSGNLQLWSTWNGLLSYLLMGALMGGEWLLRRHLIKNQTI